MTLAQSLPYRDPLRKPAIACGLLVAAAILIAAVGKPEGAKPAFAVAQPEASLGLLFTDAPDGTVTVNDATSGKALRRLPPGEGGFLRTTVRNLAMARKRAGNASEAGFTLARLPGGSLVLRDPVLDRAVLLDAFGQTNKNEFAALFAAKGEEN